MKEFKEYLSGYRILAIVLTAVLIGFSVFVFFSQVSQKSMLEKAKIVEVLQIQDDQGLVYQNFLVLLRSGQQVQVRVPISMPEVRGLEVGDSLFLQRVSGDESIIEYRYASADRMVEFLVIIALFAIVILVIVGIRPIDSIYPAMVFLILVIAGVFTLSTEIRYTFLSILGFMMIISLINILWLYQDLVLSISVSLIMTFVLLFSVLLYILLINYTRVTEVVRFEELLGKQSLIYDYDQARLLASMIFVYGLILNLVISIIKKAKEYLKTHKKASRFSMIKFNVESVQYQIAQMLNLIFFLALGLNFLSLVSEDYTQYKFIWNNSFFLGVVIDGVVVALTLVVAGYITALFMGIYFHYRNRGVREKID